MPPFSHNKFLFLHLQEEEQHEMQDAANNDVEEQEEEDRKSKPMCVCMDQKRRGGKCMSIIQWKKMLVPPQRHALICMVRSNTCDKAVDAGAFVLNRCVETEHEKPRECESVEQAKTVFKEAILELRGLKSPSAIPANHLHL
jgi:hypothetical protein